MVPELITHDLCFPSTARLAHTVEFERGFVQESASYVTLNTCFQGKIFILWYFLSAVVFYTLSDSSLSRGDAIIPQTPWCRNREAFSIQRKAGQIKNYEKLVK